jgi:hypothetical protein
MKPGVYNLGSPRSTNFGLSAQFPLKGDLGSCCHKGDSDGGMECTRRAIHISIKIQGDKPQVCPNKYQER